MIDISRSPDLAGVVLYEFINSLKKMPNSFQKR